MLRRVRDRFSAALDASREHPAESLLVALVLAAALYVIVYPFALVRYPPMTDLPFHAAQTSVLRHYFDPDYHFREQFTLHPLEVPYVSMYGLGALAALVLPISAATKLMAVCMLSLLPAGLAVLFHGMRKSPLWGVLGLGLVWTKLTHWGWLNFVGALGLYAACIGCALLALDKPSRRRQLALFGCLMGVFATHVFRLPFALLAVLGTSVVMYPATRRLRPVVWPVLAGTLVFFAWWWIRPPGTTGHMGEFAFEIERWQGLKQSIFAGFVGEVGVQEQRNARSLYWVALGTFALAALLFPIGRKLRDIPERELWWGAGVTVLPILLAAGHVFAFLMLPMRIGEWWHVYPREATAAAFIALAAMPELPKRWWMRLAMLGVIAISAGRMGFLVAREWRAFDRETRDFRAIARLVPPAPKLYYLVFDHTGTSKKDSAFVHFPAWIQAEKGGWLSFHFAGWRMYPVRYRQDSPAVPPPNERNFEWNPHRFRVTDARARWFDVFLVRSRIDPSVLFTADERVRLVAQRGTWWLLRREPPP